VRHGWRARQGRRGDTGAEDAQGVRIAYLCSEYPGVSHTFVLREVNALRRLGARIETFSIRRAKHLLADADHVAFKSTYAIVPPRIMDLIAAHLRLALTSPLAYAGGIGLMLRLGSAGPRGRLWQLFYFVEAVVLWNECRRRELRHIHVHIANAAADVALMAAHIGTSVEPDRPWSWSFTMHGPTEFFNVDGFHLVEKLRRARFVVCISDFARSQLMLHCDPDMWDKLHVIHVGIPIEQFTDDGAHASPVQADPTVLLIGRQVAEKGQGVLLEAIALLVERGLRVRATLAGDGAARGDFERLAERLGIAARVSFPGAVGQDDICALYAAASIFCLPSFAEGIPGVLMEAMAMETPVVSTRIAGIPELIEDGRTGLLVSPGRPDQLADALERLLAEPELCRAMGSAGREKVVEEFNTERSAEQLYALFLDQLAPRLTKPAPKASLMLVGGS
jgi:colanic acid/amylovoran biosynthesis glycosyltransferase